MCSPTPPLPGAQKNISRYPEWSNASDFRPTREAFGTVVLQCPDLTTAINAIDVDVSKLNLTGDQQYLAERAGTKLPLLPVYGKAECKLFAQLLLGQPTQQVRFHHISIDDSRDPERLETKI